MKAVIWSVVFILLGTAAHSQQREKKLDDQNDSELDTYLKTKKFEYVYKVTSDANKLTIYGYKPGDTKSSTETVNLEQGEVLGIWTWKYFKPTVSVMTVPYKIRRAVGKFPLVSTSGLTNLGLNFAMPEIKLDRYFSNGTKSSHNLSAGFWIAPSVEELTATNTNTPITSSSKQLYISTAASIVYTYNNIQLTFIPIGCDTATTTAGKNWAYNGRIWLGFGIGFDPKIFAPQTNK